MDQVEKFESRRRRAYTGMLVCLLALLGLIFAEVIFPGWGCRILGCNIGFLGGNPFVILTVLAALAISIYMASVETGIDRAGLREIIDDERKLLYKLKAWRSAYFSSIAGLFVFVILSGSSQAVDMPFLLGAVMVSGGVGLFSTLLYQEGKN